MKSRVRLLGDMIFRLRLHHWSGQVRLSPPRKERKKEMNLSKSLARFQNRKKTASEGFDDTLEFEAERPKPDGCNVTGSLVHHLLLGAPWWLQYHWPCFLGQWYCYLCSSVFKFASFLFVYNTFSTDLPPLPNLSKYRKAFESNLAAIFRFCRFWEINTFIVWQKEPQRDTFETRGNRICTRSFIFEPSWSSWVDTQKKLYHI